MNCECNCGCNKEVGKSYWNIEKRNKDNQVLCKDCPPQKYHLKDAVSINKVNNSLVVDDNLKDVQVVESHIVVRS